MPRPVPTTMVSMPEHPDSQVDINPGVTEDDLRHALSHVTERSPEKIEQLHKHLRALPCVVEIGLPAADGEVVRIKGTLVGRNPNAWFQVVIVFGPDPKRQMVGGVIFGRHRPGMEPEQSDWAPMNWDYIPWLVDRWSG